jgi:hypothetical protein
MSQAEAIAECQFAPDDVPPFCSQCVPLDMTSKVVKLTKVKATTTSAVTI